MFTVSLIGLMHEVFFYFNNVNTDSRFLISDIHVQNKKYGSFVFISRIAGECAKQKNSLWTCLHGHIKKPKYKNTDFFMI